MSIRDIGFLLLLVLAGSSMCAWGAPQRDLQEIPEPNPAAELAAMETLPGVEVNLFAADPLLFKPIHMQFGPDGKLWVAGSSVYPQLAPGETADDKIFVLEDTNGDGVADRSTVFAEHLLIPTGVLPDETGHGAYVAASTQLLHFRDLDGDGRADERQIVLSGFGTEDTHHMLHTLRWGNDGWLYMNQSIYIHSHIETPYGIKHLDGGGIWRFHPPTGKLEVVCKGFVNPWGHVQDGIGQSFATDGAYGEGINPVFPGAVFVTSPGAERWLAGLNPGSPKHCGLEIWSGMHPPPEWQGIHVTNDFRSHRVCLFDVRWTPGGYVSQPKSDLIRSRHIAFRPIDCKVGPDGALYVADWYNPIIQHGEVDFRDSRRDRTHGRIWRVTWKDRPLETQRYSPSASLDDRLKGLEQPLESLRTWNRLSLLHSDPIALQEKVEGWFSEPNPSSGAWLNSGISISENRQLEALRWMAARDQWNLPLVKSLIANANPRVRAMACQLASWKVQEWDNAVLDLEPLVQDMDWQVRLNAIVALRRLGTPSALKTALLAVDQLDSASELALWYFVREFEAKEPLSLIAEQLANNPKALLYLAKTSNRSELSRWMTLHVGTVLADKDHRGELLAAIAPKLDTGSLTSLLGWMESSLQEGSLSLPDATSGLRSIGIGTEKVARDNAGIASWLKRAAAIPTSNAKADVSQDDVDRWHLSLVEASMRWRVPSMEDWVVELLQGVVAGGRARVEMASVLPLLGNVKAKRIRDFLDQSITSFSEPNMRTAALLALVRQDADLASRIWVDAMERGDDGLDAFRLMQEFTSREESAQSLLTQLEPVQHLGKNVASEMLRGVNAKIKQGENLSAWIRKLSGEGTQRWEWSPELATEILGLVQSEGDPSRGEKLFRRATLQCNRCHPLGVSLGLIGPNLMSLGGSAQQDYLLESLLVPDAKLKEGFQTLVVTLDDGSLVSGLLRSRTASNLSLLTADGSVQDIPMSTIEGEVVGKSLMPSGLVDGLTKGDLADLVAFLSALGRVDNYSVKQDDHVRRVELLAGTPSNHQQLNRKSLDALIDPASQWTWQVAFGRVDGTLPWSEIPLQKPHANLSPFASAKFTLEVLAPGPAVVSVEGGIVRNGWLDEISLESSEELKMELQQGIHTVTLCVEPDRERNLEIRIAPRANVETKLRIVQ